ncbi:MAG: TRAP transporter fused permease subunit [Streptosporangiales bacterium]|nr:TRAP transporter fused permease subunit [Streptosporangiales bacterium]
MKETIRGLLTRSGRSTVAGVATRGAEDVRRIGEEDATKVDEALRLPRHPKGAWRWIIYGIAVVYSGYYLYTAQFGIQSPQAHRGLYWGGAGILILLLYPLRKNRGSARVPFYDIALALLTAAATGYFVFGYGGMVERAAQLTGLDIAFGVVAVVLSLEVTRRTAGWWLTAIGLAAIGYSFYGPYMPGIIAHRGYDLERFVATAYASFNGIFGVVAHIFATFVFIFIIFGAFLQKSGAAQFLVDLPFAIAGKARGGPAKVAVFVSALMGSVSGSPVANVMTTGTFTIPLMKRVGYRSEFAGGVEAAASTGGQLLPPVMGAGAFIIAEFTRTSYLDIVLVSIIPALLYFLSVYLLVDFRALKSGLQGLPATDLPSPWKIFKEGWFFLLPLVVIFVLIVLRYSPAFAGFWAVVTAIVVGMIPYRGQRMRPRDLLDALNDGAVRALSIAGIVGTIGIVVGIVNLTGLGLRFSDLVVSLSGGNLLIAIIFVTIASWLLGMGLTVTSSYIVVAILAAPALESLGTSLIAAHLIIFWVSQDANLTPPVCLSAFAGASIAGGKPMATGWESWKLGRGLYIVPFLMAFSPLVDGPWLAVIPVVFTAVLGIYALTAGMSGYLLRDTRRWEAALLLVAGVLLIYPGYRPEVAGGALLAALLLLQWTRTRRAGGEAG